MKAIAMGMLALGFLLLIVSGLWSSLFPPTSAWTNEKALRLSEVQERLSNIGPIVNSPTRRMHSGPDPATLKAEFDALQIENEQLNAEFTTAAERPQTMSKILKWTGISLAVFGIIGWYAVKQS
jgi:hypothetical protein